MMLFGLMERKGEKITEPKILFYMHLFSNVQSSGSCLKSHLQSLNLRYLTIFTNLIHFSYEVHVPVSRHQEYPSIKIRSSSLSQRGSTLNGVVLVNCVRIGPFAR
jgi:hypothetical protein